MLTSQSLEIISRLIKYGRFLGTVPYDWDAESESISLRTSRRANFLFYAGGSHILLFIVYLISALFKGGINYFTILWIILWLTYYSWMFTSFINAVMKKRDVITLFKALKLLNDQCCGNWFKTFPHVYKLILSLVLFELKLSVLAYMTSNLMPCLGLSMRKQIVEWVWLPISRQGINKLLKSNIVKGRINMLESIFLLANGLQIP